jgi:hypothetical protein
MGADPPHRHARECRIAVVGFVGEKGPAPSATQCFSSRFRPLAYHDRFAITAVERVSGWRPSWVSRRVEFQVRGSTQNS